MTPTTTTVPAPTPTRPLQYLPVALFGSSMGLTGLSVAWRLAHARFGLPEVISHLIAAGAVAVFAALLAAYGVKAAFAPDAVRAEFRHPVAGHMFGLLIANLLLLPIVLAPLSLALARALWGAGAVLMVGFTLRVANRWLAGLREWRATATPAWIVPAVGLLDVPLAAPALQLPPPLHQALLLCWAVGLALSVPLLAVVGARLVFGAPLPVAMQPTLLILMAPAAVGASSHAALSGGRVDLLGFSLFGIGLLLLVVFSTQLRGALRAPFKTIWWATSFPLAACAIASLQVAAAAQSRVTDGLAALLLGLASLVIAVLLFHTLRGLGQGRLREIV